MSFMRKPAMMHSKAPRNALGLSLRDYEGGMSTLCAGCGHDSITAALIQAYFESDVPPHEIVKLSGIGCSSKTPAYFVSQAHGINTVHGRMPSVATGANAANGNLRYVGVSGDGDSLSIGMGQLVHAIRRNVDMVYVIENNGVYGLTKGQFSASADVGSKAKKGEANVQPPVDPAVLGITLGAGFVARSFSGDKAQLVGLLKAAIAYRGFALIDVVSPCVTFNDHEASTKSFLHTREHYNPTVHADLVVPRATISAEQKPGTTTRVPLHDGSEIALQALDDKYDPQNQAGALEQLMKFAASGKVTTGLLYINPKREDMHQVANTVAQPLNSLSPEALQPGQAGLDKVFARYR